MIPYSLLVAFFSAHTAELRRLRSEDGDRGEIVQTVVIIALFVAAAIVIVAILVGKATTAANNVQTQ